MKLIAKLLIILLFSGCQTATEKADGIRNDIKGKTAEIEAAAAKTQANIEKADRKVITATTQPGNPPITTALLRGAHVDLADATEALKPIAPAVKAINVKATEAAILTQETDAKLADERNHWLGYKTRRLLWIVAIVGGILGVGAFLVRTFGLGVIGGFAGDAFAAVWKFALLIFIPAWNVLTLGLDWIGKKINAKYDAVNKK